MGYPAPRSHAIMGFTGMDEPAGSRREGSPVLCAVLVSLLVWPTAGCAGSLEPPAEARLLNPPPTQVPGFVRELVDLPVVLEDGHRLTLDVLITRPRDPGALPLVVLSTTTAPDGEEARRAVSPTWFSAQAMAFARHGYATAVVLRRGTGRSQGGFAEQFGPCSNTRYDLATRAGAEDLAAAVAALAHEPWVDPARIVLVGKGGGGLSSLATAARATAGIVGVISFAGGRGSDGADHVCQSERLTATLADLGAHVRVPSLWVYAENDRSFSQGLAHDMAAAYSSGGAPLQFVEAPAFEQDGNLLFDSADIEAWWQWVGPFLAGLKLPTTVVHPATPSLLIPPPRLDAEGQAAFGEYAASERFEKAFAVGSSGQWGRARGQRTARQAAAAALEFCRTRPGSGCALYAVGDAYALPSP